MLVGREEERARIDRLLEDARAGRSGVLVLRGEAGIGKTTLLDYAAERAAGMTIVRALGVETEAELDFSALLELCRPLLRHLDELPGPAAQTLRVALGLDSGEPQDRFSVGVATLGLLAAAAEADPLLVLADDAHWLDRPSADALLFAVRRLEADRVAFVFAVREEEAHRFEAPGLPSIDFGGLDAAATRDLLAGSGSNRIAPSILERLHTETRGNPLALLELCGSLTPAQLAAEDPLPDILPTGRLIEQAFLGRMQPLDEDARTALLVAALSTSGELDAVAGALATLDVPARSLEPAEDAGLLRIDNGRIDFRHPLARSAVSASAAPSARRTVHRALAAVERGERRAWHLAAAALGPDEEAAAAIESAALQALGRSGYAAAGAALERSARLSLDAPSRVRRLTLSADAYWRSGRSTRARALIDEALSELPDPVQRSGLLHLRGRMATFASDLGEAKRDLLEAAGLVEESDPALAVEILSDAVEAHELGVKPAETVEIAKRARALAPKDGGPADLLAEIMLVHTMMQSGQPQIAHGHADRVLSLVEANPSLVSSTHSLYRVALCLVWCNRLVEAETFARRAVALARERGEVPILAYSLELVVNSAGRQGRPRDAYAAATEGVQLARESNQPLALALLLTHLTWYEAFRGAEATCRAYADEALVLSDKPDTHFLTWWVECALGMLELGLGRLEAVVERLGPVADRLEASGFHDVAASPFPNIVEACVRLGRTDEAAAAFERYLKYGPGTSLRWSEAVAHRCRGLLADETELDEPFVAGIETHPKTDPFGLARTRLCYGERLRRAGRRREAREQLRSALEAFEALGADPWAERARSELRASGERIRKRDAAEPEELTPQELQIALQVADGKTNKEVGSALFLSHKTVEFHLARVYRKLGISSRGELIRQFAAGAAPAGV